MANRHSGEALAEWRGGWPTVLVASLGISLSTVHIYSQGLFMAPLEQTFGWTRTQITTGPFLLSLISGFCILFSGVIADRFGARRILLLGLPLYALAMATLLLTRNNLWQWYGSWVLIALAMPLVTPAVWTSAVVARFSVSRGFALAVALAGNGLSSAIAPQIIERLIEDHGWRGGFAFFPVYGAAVILPLTLLMFDRSPRRAATTTADERARDMAAELPILATMRTPPFLLLVAAGCLFAFGLMALMAHLLPIITERGLDRATAAAAVGAAGLCSIGGRLGTGYLLDRFSSRVVAPITFLLPLLPVLLLTQYDGSVGMAFVISILLGMSLGAEVDLVAYLTARYFGARRYATFVGIVHGTGALSVGGGPLVGGIIHDATGSYDLLLWILIPVFAAGTIAILLLGRLPPREGRNPAAEHEAELLA